MYGERLSGILMHMQCRNVAVLLRLSEANTIGSCCPAATLRRRCRVCRTDAFLFRGAYLITVLKAGF